MINAVVIDEKDTVAVAIEALKKRLCCRNKIT